MRCAYCGSDQITRLNDTQFQCEFCQKITHIHAKNDLKPPAQKSPIDFSVLFTSVFRLKGENGHGTGFIVAPSGHVITNAHVIKNSPILEGTLGHSPVLFELEPISDGALIDLDLALLSIIDAPSIPGLKLANDVPDIGEEVFILGHPKHLGQSLTRATISKINPQEIQLNTTLNPGNSGGPVVNASGEVIGVVSYLIEDVQGMAFAVRLETIQSFLKKTFEYREENHV